MFYNKENLPSAFEQFREIITECGQNDLLNELHRIKTMIDEPYFTLSVVGEFSRGKSTIINKLLETDILPVGVLPTTARLTYITYGEEAKLKIIRPDCMIFEQELSSEAWDSIMDESDNSQDNSFLQVTLNNDWLRKSCIRLVDSPGAGDLHYEKLNMTIDTISSSDGVFIAISSTMAMSSTEKTFGALITIGGGILGEKMLQNSIEEQKKYIGKELEKLVDDNFRKNINCLNQRMEETYSKILFALKEQEEASLKMEKNIIKNMADFDTGDLNKIDDLINKLDDIINKLEGDISL
jgi:hypothetical protein